MPQSRIGWVPPPVLVLAAIASVQIGSALARTLFDDLGAAGVTLLRVGLASLLLLAVLRPTVHTWSLGHGGRQRCSAWPWRE
jgi:inner membrane transporter RhtA